MEQEDHLKFLLVKEGTLHHISIERTLRKKFQDLELTETDQTEAVGALLGQAHFDVVLTEHYETDAFRVFRTITARRPDLPIIMITDTSHEALGIAAVEAGFGDYVLTEHLPRLPLAVRKILEKARQQKAYQDMTQRYAGHGQPAEQMKALRKQEYARIARELHDELGQELTVLKLDLYRLRKQLPPQARVLQEEAAAIGRHVDKLIDSVRLLSGELHLGPLVECELGPAIDRLLRDFQNRTAIRCRLRLALGQRQLDLTRSRVLFRILQEAITNVARHAQATEVLVELGLEQAVREVVLTIRDNGRGISQAEATNSFSLGFLGMQERALSVGGRVTITGIGGKGTKVEARLPLD